MWIEFNRPRIVGYSRERKSDIIGILPPPRRTWRLELFSFSCPISSFTSLKKENKGEKPFGKKAHRKIETGSTWTFQRLDHRRAGPVPSENDRSIPLFLYPLSIPIRRKRMGWKRGKKGGRSMRWPPGHLHPLGPSGHCPVPITLCTPILSGRGFSLK